jgi:DNA primase
LEVGDVGRISETVIDEVLGRSDILSTVQRYVTLKKAGHNHKGLCPFHQEKTPSFNVHGAKGIYKCFGCGAGGNVINFVMQIEGWSFPETVRFLAQSHGVSIESADPEEEAAAEKKREGKRLYLQIMGWAKDFYCQSLWSRDGLGAQQYLSERGIDEETARRFELGYAPNGWQHLIDAMSAKGMSSRHLERAGLALERQQASGHYDRFRHRIMFPVIDIWSNPLAFSGRVFAAQDDGPKYINSSETSFYTKGSHLYGLSVAKQAIQRRGMALLVEGNFDVVSLHAKGIDVAVAPMGTAFTEVQAKLLSRYCRRVIIALDGDKAGQEATRRCMLMFDRVGVDAEVVRLDEGDDPDAFVQRRGPEAFEELLVTAKPGMSHEIDRVIGPAAGGTIEEKIRCIEDLGELMRGMQSQLRWEHYVEEISRRLSIEPRLMREYIQRPKIRGDLVRDVVSDVVEPTQLESAEYGLLVVLLDHPEYLSEFFGESYDNLLQNEDLAEFLQVVEGLVDDAGGLDTAAMLQHIEDQNLRQAVADALVDQDRSYRSDKARVWFDDCIRRIQRTWAERTIFQLTETLDRTDFYSERSRYEVLTNKKREIEQFRCSLEVEESRV